MIRLVARAGDDLSQARPYDRWWWRRLSWLIDAQENEKLERTLENKLSVYCAALARTEDPNNARKIFDQIDKLETALEKLRFPWKETSKKDRYKAMRELWKHHWGDPNDPDVQKKIENTNRILRERAERKQKPRAAPLKRRT